MVALMLVTFAFLLFASSASAYNNGAGELPPMGWNTWCTDDICGLMDLCFEDQIMSVAQSIVAQGLDKLGYVYINMDDCWADKERNATGHMQANPERFPNGMQALASYIHSLGLKFGLYTCVGTHTCKWNRPGSYDNWEIDAQTFAYWGMDFIKADNCAKPGNITEQEAYGNLSQALNATGRPMLFSLCEWGVDEVQEWGGDVGQMYRIQMDHLPFWHFPPKAAGNGFGQGTGDIIEYIGTLNPSTFVKPYGWMDPDFLETMFPTFSFIESRTEFSFWSLWSAPLICATDVRDLNDNPDKKAILTNAEVIAIDQDPAGIAGDRIYNGTDGGQIWTKPLANGDYAAIFYNAHNDIPISLTLQWTQIGWPASTSVSVRDLWNQTTEGTFTESFTSLPIHARDVQMVRLTKV